MIYQPIGRPRVPSYFPGADLPLHEPRTTAHRPSGRGRKTDNRANVTERFTRHSAVWTNTQEKSEKNTHKFAYMQFFLYLCGKFESNTINRYEKQTFSNCSGAGMQPMAVRRTQDSASGTLMLVDGYANAVDRAFPWSGSVRRTG